MAVTYKNFNGNEQKLNQAKLGMKNVLGKIGKLNKYLNDLKNAYKNGVIEAEAKDFEKPYITWFGELDENRISIVANNIHNMLHALTNSNITICYLGSSCKKGDYAYTSDVNEQSLNDVSVNLCEQYFIAPALGQDSQTGTLIHEYTHILFNTADHKYGKKDCKKLAQDNPDNAINNADNYEYIIEEQPDK